MSKDERDFEIRVQGHTLVRVSDGGVKVDGKDFHADLKSLSELIDILSDVVNSAQEAGKPRLVAAEGAQRAAKVTLKAVKAFPYKIISNA